MKNILALLIATTALIKVYGQGEIPVDMYTGTPAIFVDLYTLTDHDLSENLRISYNANESGHYGYGWNLSAGGPFHVK
jgi:hypothetical protein